MWTDLRFRLRALFRRSSLERELADELEFHLEQQMQKHLKAGLSREEAARLARLDFGALERAREQCREARGVEAMDSTIKDVRYAFRLFRKSPAFTLLAVLSLALGTGVNTAVFSVVHAVLLKPLPYIAPDRIVSIGRSVTMDALAIPEFDFLKQHSAAFASIAGYRPGGERRVIAPAGERQVSMLRVTADFLRVLQLRTAIGRDFTGDDMRLGAPQAMIISDAVWRSAFGSSPDVVGKQLRMEDASYTIVGVLPREFWFPQDVDALLPLRPTGSLSDKGTNTTVIGRLGDSFNLRQAQAEAGSIAQEFRRTAMDVENSDFQQFLLMPLHDRLVGDVRLNLELLFGATGLLVLIGCSNLASLLMTRLANRRSEFAVRLAIGGSTSRILRQLFIENFLLAGMGSIAGIACAYGLLRGLMGIIPFELPATGPITINVSVLLFTIAVSCLTTLLFTIVPFFSNTQVNCDEALRIGGRSISGGRRQARNALVVTEVALSTLLLIGAGLLINSLHQLYQEELGFKADGVLSVGTEVGAEQRVNSATFSAFTTDMLQAIRSTGVSRIAAVNVLPLEGQSNIPTQRYGHTDQNIGGMEIRLVTPEYFEIMGIPLRQGRGFGERDSEAAAPVAIVSEAVVRRWWPDGKALGDKLIIGRFNDRDFNLNDPPREVVGVVGDTKTRNLKDPARSTLYIPVPQAPASLIGNGRMVWVFAHDGAAPSLPSVRAAIERLVPANRIGTFRTMDDLIRANIRNPTFNAWLFGVFAGVAVALAAIGIFGLLSYTVTQRRQEIGMRIALGATRADVVRLVIKQGIVLIAAGLILGVSAALFLTRYLTTMLYRIKANDPLSYVAVIAILAAIGLLASYIPARRATRIDPMAALRW